MSNRFTNPFSSLEKSIQSISQIQKIMGDSLSTIGQLKAYQITQMPNIDNKLITAAQHAHLFTKDIQYAKNMQLSLLEAQFPRGVRDLIAEQNGHKALMQSVFQHQSVKNWAAERKMLHDQQHALIEKLAKVDFGINNPLLENSALLEAAFSASKLSRFPTKSWVNDSIECLLKNGVNHLNLDDIAESEVEGIVNEVEEARDFTALSPQTKQRVINLLFVLYALWSDLLYPYYLGYSSEQVMKDLHQTSQMEIVARIENMSSDFRAKFSYIETSNRQRASDLKREMQSELRSMRQEIRQELRKTAGTEKLQLVGYRFAKEVTSLKEEPSIRSKVVRIIPPGKLIKLIKSIDPLGLVKDRHSRAWIFVGIESEGHAEPVTGWVLRSHTLAPR